MPEKWNARTQRNRLSGAAIVFLVLVVATSTASADSDAERLYAEGQHAYDAKNFDAALVAWKQSYELSKLPALVFNIAQAHRLRGDCTDAVANYKRFIALDPTASERGDAEGFIKDLEPTCPKPVIKLGKAIVTPETPKPKRDPNAGSGKRIAGLVLAGGGISLVAVGALFGSRATSLADEVNTDCADGCDWDVVKGKDADGRAAARNQYIAYGAGGVAIIAAGVLYWLGSRDREQAITVTAKPGGGAISWTRRW